MDASAEAPEGKRTASANTAVVRSLVTAAGIAALVVLVIISITGGFTINAGPLHLSAHNWRGPLVIALVALGAAARSGRAAFAEAAAANWQFIDDHALALVMVLAAVTAGAGIAYGTYSASSSDASGYVSQSRLLAS